MPHALLSDIHGNMRAFDAVLGELARFGIDSGLVLGDVPTNTNEEIGGSSSHAVLAFHGSPRDFDDILFPDTVDVSPWQVDGYALLAGGHTHFQWTTRVGEALYVNPGSVGLPIYRWNDRRPLEHAEYAIVDGPSVEFRRCVY